MRVEDRPFATEPIHTADLPPTPTRDRRIPAAAWVEAPESLLALGDRVGAEAEYKRRIGRFLLWRAGPPVGEADYLAIDPECGDEHAFALHGRTGAGVGPDGTAHVRLRTWKESLRDAGGCQ